ncbi:MAG: peptide MFS transporter [Planctomycetota bacterium]
MFAKHPKGLAPLFFTEMWERLSFYLLVGVLVLYASDVESGGLGLTRDAANSINGTYLAFVYFTPFLGGMIADRLLGYRRSVFIGGLLFATGLVLLGIKGMSFFYAGLIFLCLGNGLFKPNISAMVGNLYEKGDPNRDTGFNLFYMGINVGAATANLAAAPLRNYISWSWTFWAAAIGIGIGLVVLVANWKTLERADRPPERTAEDTPASQVFGMILLPALVLGGAAYFLHDSILDKDSPVTDSMFGFLVGMLPVIFYFVRLPKTVAPKESAGLAALIPVFVAGGTFFMVLHLNSSALTVWAKDNTDRQVAMVPAIWTQTALPSYFENAAPEVPRPPEIALEVVDDVKAKAYGTKRITQTMLGEIRQIAGLEVVTLWDRDRPAGTETTAADDKWKPFASEIYPDSAVSIESKTVDGKTAVKIRLADGAQPTSKVVFLRKAEEKTTPLFLLTQADKDKVYKKASTARLPVGEVLTVVDSVVYQSWNPIFVILFTPLVVAFFAARSRKGAAISTPRKLLYGMLLTAASMGVMAIAGFAYESASTKVAGMWLVGTFAVITIGELCLSPMGLSLVTKLAPKRLVGMMMGGWFCATAFGNKLSGFFGEIQNDLAPSTFFLVLTGAALLVAVYLLTQLGKLERTMKEYQA